MISFDIYNTNAYFNKEYIEVGLYIVWWEKPSRMTFFYCNASLFS